MIKDIEELNPKLNAHPSPTNVFFVTEKSVL